MNSMQYRIVLSRGLRECGLSVVIPKLPLPGSFQEDMLKQVVGESQDPKEILLNAFEWQETPEKYSYWQYVCRQLKNNLDIPFSFEESKPKKNKPSRLIKDNTMVDEAMKDRDLEAVKIKKSSKCNNSQPQPWFLRMAPLDAKLNPFK